MNVIKFVTLANTEAPAILSGSTDKSIRIWRNTTLLYPSYEEVTSLKSHLGSINCIAVGPAANVFASGSADATVKIWGCKDPSQPFKFQLLETILTSPRFFPLALALHGIGESGDLVLAVAGTKGFVQIFVSERGGAFCCQTTLSGHEDWIRSLAFTTESTQPGSDILLASASQDKYLRLWRIHQVEESSHLSQSRQKPQGLVDKSLSNKIRWLQSSQISYSLTFEALLLGHEDWVYSVSWRSNYELLQLLSASADGSLALWEPEANSGVWVCTTRLGEISAQKGSTTATGSAGGFWTALWSPSGDAVLSLGKTGGWRVWKYNKNQKRWMQKTGISGHTKAVLDIAWERAGAYLLSTGSDQTTRLHAEWRRKRVSGNSWHEFARPQIHGYDLNCLDSIGQSQFISGAEEKLLRVFDEPRPIADLLHTLCGASTINGQQMPEAASVPVLGLSNKEVKSTEANKSAPESEIESEELSDILLNTRAEPLDLEFPPLEDDLARRTLWPEKEKLYGHGYEISAVASSHDGSIVATSCKASSVDHAVIRLYSTNNWREVKPPLVAHSLTVTSLKFSSDDLLLLSVGRDRQWAVFERGSISSTTYKKKESRLKAHSRMILDAAWVPTEASRIFATAGRDNVAKVWKMQTEGTECVATMTSLSPVTAISIYHECIMEKAVCAIGTEDSEVVLYTLDVFTLNVQASGSLDKQ